MARTYPKFIYQHVTNAKSKGRFIMHLLQPAVLLSVHEEGRSVKLKLEEVYTEGATEDAIRPVMQRALDWYLATQREASDQTEDGKANLVTGIPIRDAYEQMISTRGIGTSLQIERSTASNLRRDVRLGKYPTDNTMREQLKKAGWRCLQEEKWLPMKEGFGGYKIN